MKSFAYNIYILALISERLRDNDITAGIRALSKFKEMGFFRETDEKPVKEYKHGDSRKY